MQLHHVLTFLAASFLGQTIGASTFTFNQPLNGWYECLPYTNDAKTSTSGLTAECATFAPPLCYPGICKAPANARPTIDVFVKRLPASIGDAEKASNVWLINGGPGFPTTRMEATMVLLHESLEGAVNVYTMDLRGVGRSTLLDCVAAQAMTSGSLYGRLIHPLEVSSCARELHNKYGDLASFSTTSAAMDVSTFISEYTNGASTIVYGLSYGTLVVQRLMHFNPSNVTGYVLDSIVTTTGAPDDRAYLTSWDADFDDVGERFMALCAQDSECDSHFKTINLSATLHNVLSTFDSNPNSTCATLIRNSTGSEPSEGLRRELGMLLEIPATRLQIPPLVYRLSRCGTDDVNVLAHFFEAISTIPPSIHQDTSELIYNMVTFSELWEIPTHSYAELEKRFSDASISSGALYEFVSLYCAFSKEKSPACDGFGLGNYEANGIMYVRDQYYAEIPPVSDHASVLLMNGNLDPLTHPRYAVSLYEALNTTRKELILFDFASHGVVNSTVFEDGVRTCGMELLASYIASNGDLKRLDKSCMAMMPAFNMTLSPKDSSFYFGTNDAYDGVFTP